MSDKASTVRSSSTKGPFFIGISIEQSLIQLHQVRRRSHLYSKPSTRRTPTSSRKVRLDICSLASCAHPIVLMQLQQHRKVIRHAQNLDAPHRGGRRRRCMAHQMAPIVSAQARSPSCVYARRLQGRQIQLRRRRQIRTSRQSLEDHAAV